MQFAIETLNIDSDMLVIAGDNVLDFSLTKFIDYVREKRTSCIMRYYESERARLQKCGVVEIDENDRILGMEEKPQEPRSHWCCPPFYYYTKEDSRRIAEGIAAGCGTDAPGSYVAWLQRVAPVHAMEMPGKRYDIGSLQSYEQVQRDYHGMIK